MNEQTLRSMNLKKHESNKSRKIQNCMSFYLRFAVISTIDIISTIDVISTIDAALVLNIPPPQCPWGVNVGGWNWEGPGEGVGIRLLIGTEDPELLRSHSSHVQ